MDYSVFEALRQPLPLEIISIKSGRGNTDQPYVEYSAMVDYLMNIDPTFGIDIVREMRDYLPGTDKNNNPIEIPYTRMVVALTFQGVTRSNTGDGEGENYGGADKKAFANALNRAAMLFGCGIELWQRPQEILAAVIDYQRKTKDMPIEKARGIYMSRMNGKQADYIVSNLKGWLGMESEGPHMENRIKKRLGVELYGLFALNKTWGEVWYILSAPSED